jgi:hypothetical protein
MEAIYDNKATESQIQLASDTSNLPVAPTLANTYLLGNQAASSW